ncbi:MAG: hypothetical protein ABSA70_03120 [Terriglobia bacterium]
MRAQLEQLKKLLFGESGALDLRTQEERRNFAVEGDNENGEPGFLEGHVAALRLSSDEAGALEGPNRFASGNSREARHTRTSTWLVMTSGLSANRFGRVALR